MEGILEQLDKAVVSEDTDRPNKDVTSFDTLFKNRGRGNNQEERRRQLLESQKRSRNNKLDNRRGILDIVDAVEMEVEYIAKRKARYIPKVFVSGFHRASLSYRNALMVSEWLLEKPEDFHDKWYVVPCPKGTRSLLVATKGSTKCYSKYGSFIFECQTALPGGNSQEKRVSCCVLDCVWQEKNNTMYVLDLLAWNNQPMTDCETEFRQYWMRTQFADCPNLRVINRRNHVVFSLLPKFQCTPQCLNEIMMTFPPFEGNFPPLDGLLFYHKEAHYTGGPTPLVGWLFPYMVQEVLGEEITVNERFIESRPVDYSSQTKFIEKFEAKYSKNKKFSYRLSNESSNGIINANASETTNDSSADQPKKKKSQRKKKKPIKIDDNSMEAENPSNEKIEDNIENMEEDTSVAEENRCEQMTTRCESSVGDHLMEPTEECEENVTNGSQETGNGENNQNRNFTSEPEGVSKENDNMERDKEIEKLMSEVLEDNPPESDKME